MLIGIYVKLRIFILKNSLLCIIRFRTRKNLLKCIIIWHLSYISFKFLSFQHFFIMKSFVWCTNKIFSTCKQIMCNLICYFLLKKNSPTYKHVFLCEKVACCFQSAKTSCAIYNEIIPMIEIIFCCADCWFIDRYSLVPITLFSSQKSCYIYHRHLWYRYSIDIMEKGY